MRDNLGPGVIFAVIYIVFQYIIVFPPIAYLALFVSLLFGAKVLILSFLSLLSAKNTPEQDREENCSLFKQRVSELEPSECLDNTFDVSIIGEFDSLTGKQCMLFLTNNEQRQRQTTLLRKMLSSDFPEASLPDEKSMIEGVEILDEESLIVYLEGELGNSISPIYDGAWRY